MAIEPTTVPSDPAVFFGMTVTNIISLIAAAASLVLGVVNYCRTNAMRANSNKLEHFNNSARQPIIAALLSIGECADEIEMLIRRQPLNRDEKIDKLSNRFHSARRNLDRTLNQLQSSEIVPGDNWVSLQHTECDSATDALEDARVADTDTKYTKALNEFLLQATKLSRRLHATLDAHSKPLMR